MRNATSKQGISPESTTKGGGTMHSLVVLASVAALVAVAGLSSADDSDIQIDAAASANTGTTPAHTLSVNMTVGNNTNRYFAVGVSLSADTTSSPMPSADSITWTVGANVQSLTYRTGQNTTTGGVGTARSAIWQIVAPTVGSGTIKIELDTSSITNELADSSPTGATTVTNEMLASADNTTTDFQFPPVLANLPVVPGTLFITDGTYTGTDDGGGDIPATTGIVSGGIDYANGEWNISFSTAPAIPALITATYNHGKRNFSGTLAKPTIEPSTVTFSAIIGTVTKTATDNGLGVLLGDGGAITGTINYSTGAWTLNFTTPPDASTNITATYDSQNTAQMVVGGLSLHNVHQTNPSTNASSGNGGDIAGDVFAASSVTGKLRDLAFGVVATTGPAVSLTPWPGMTERWKTKIGTGNPDAFAAAATYPNTTAVPPFISSTLVQWFLSSLELWSISVVNIQPPYTPTEARFADARAFSTEAGTLLKWRTAHEVRNLGFRVYREDEHGQRVLLNRSLIAGSALFAGPSTELSVGRSYVFWDADAGQHASRYWLEAVDLNGRKTWYGPFLSEPVSSEQSISGLGGRSPSEARLMSNPRLARLGRGSSSSASVVKGFDSGSRQAGHRVGGSNGQWRMAGAEAAKILVDRAGWYRVTRSELAAAGFDPGPDAVGLELYNQGHQEAIRVVGVDDGTFDMSDAIEFYGEAVDTPATGANVYWLINGTRPGRRLTEVQGASGTADPVASYPATVTLQDRSIYVAAVTTNGDRDNFYGPVVGSEPGVQALNVDALPAAGAVGPTSLEIALQGLTTQNHRVAVGFNGHQLEEMEFSGTEHAVRSYAIDPAWLLVGANEVTLEALDGDEDISVTDYLELTWQRPYTASNDRLEMTAPAGATVRVSGFSDEAIRLFDLTNPYATVEIHGSIEQDLDGSWAIEAELTGTASDGDRALYAVAENGVFSPASVEANASTSWHARNHLADMVIISHPDLMAAAERLAAYRSAHGVSTVAVNVIDLYDEFSWGIKDPNAIRAFLAQTTAVWQEAPDYALLMGDANFDPRNYLGFGNGDLVPTMILASNLLKTANDDWFADLDGDGLANLAVGRLPAASIEDANSMVDKIIGYEQETAGTWTENLTLVIDEVTGDFDFGAAADALEGLIPVNLVSDRIDLDEVDQATAHQMILDAFDDGRLLINYDGHGSQTIWASDDVFENDDAFGLENGFKLPLVVAMNCLNGFFHDVYQESLSEALLANPNGGAVMVWASSALTDPLGQDWMNRDLYRSLFGGDNPSIGDAVMAAKANVTDQDIRDTWILFGDPSMKLKQ